MLHDLCPYVCIFKNCQRPDALYRTSELWMEHMRNEHTSQTWRCATCEEVSEFQSSEGFAKHINSHHAGEFSAEEANVITQFAVCREPATVAYCVVCGWKPESEQSQTLADYQPEILRHVAVEHLQGLSLLSLPWSANAGNSTTVTSLSDSSSMSKEKDDDYRYELLQDVNLDPRGDGEINPSGDGDDGNNDDLDLFADSDDGNDDYWSDLTEFNLAEVATEDDTDYTRSWLDHELSTSGSDTEREETTKVGEQTGESHSNISAVTKAFLMDADLSTWLGAKDSSPPHITDGIIPYLESLNSWHLLSSEAIASFRKLQRTHGSPLLWLHGPSRCGKTTFSWAVREIWRLFPPKRRIVLFYSFHQRVDEQARTMESALCSLIYQTDEQVDSFQSLDDLYSSCKKGANYRRRPATSELVQCFEDALVDEDNQFEIFIDSLDSCPMVSEFSHWLQDMARRYSHSVRIIATSRYAPVISIEEDSAFEDKPFLVMSVLSTEEEIGEYIREEMRKDTIMEKWPEDTDLGHDLVTRMMSVAHGK